MSMCILIICLFVCLFVFDPLYFFSGGNTAIHQYKKEFAKDTVEFLESH